MRLTYFTDHSVKVLLFAATKNDELSTIKEMSQLYDLSSNHLMKVVHHLGKGGYLHTVRGKNGGFRIGKKAEDIYLGELIRYTEDDLNIVKGPGEEDRDNSAVYQCDFASVMNEAMKAFLDVADCYTLADLV